LYVNSIRLYLENKKQELRITSIKKMIAQLFIATILSKIILAR
jgi:hypothetical protein